MNLNPRRSVRPWYAILLAAVAAGVIIFGITQLGTPATSSARTSTEEVAAANGVIQTTVSGSGEVEPGVDDTLNFATSGTLQSVDVKVGQHVKKGQLIATLDPSSAELTLESAKASLTSAEDNLTEVEDGTSTGSSSTGSSNNSTGSSSQQTATAASAATTVYAAFRKPADSTTTGTTTSTAPTTTTTTTTGATTTEATTTQTVTVTVPATTGTKTSPAKNPTKTKLPTTTKKPTKTTVPTTTKKPTTTNKPTTTTKVAGKQTTGVTIKAGTNRTGTTTTAAATTTTKSKPTAAEIQQAEVQVNEAKATVAADEKAVKETKLYAPASGMIASLSSDSIGQTVSSGSSSSAAASQSSANSSSSTTGNSSSSSSGFAELINDNTMTMTVSLSEDDISNVKVGQMATVSITALSGVELAGRVSSISPLGTDSSGVVSYDATITVNQSNSKVFPGMSATASIVTGQAQGVTVPNDAITGGGSDASVQLVTNGKVTTQAVVIGLKGSSRSQIVSGLKAGQDVKVTITLPSLGTSTTSSSSSSSTNGLGGLGGGAFPGGAGGGTGFRAAARAFFGGGGG